MRRFFKPLFIIISLVVILLPLQSFALTPQERFEIERNYWYDKTDCSTDQSTTSGGSDVFIGNNNGQIAFNFFVAPDKGLTKEQAAGIVGNLQAESGVNPTAVNSIGATGIAQWLGGRKTAMLAFSPNPLTLESQLRFIWFEGTQSAEKPGFDRFLAETANDVGAEGAAHAAVVFEDTYERSGGALLPQRQEYARQAFELFGPQAGTSAQGTSAAGDACNKTTITGNDGLDVFPLQDITQTILRSGAEGATWCFANPTNCHGAYKAADIHVPVGTVVVAGKGGVVVSTNDQSGGMGSNVVIKGQDGKYIYYYTHMAFGSLKVSEGQTVSSDQPIGNVGDSGQANGTAPHLHIDMLPADQFNDRPACSRSNCPIKDSFIDVQAFLHALYQQLPN